MIGDALAKPSFKKMRRPNYSGLYGKVSYKRPLELLTAREQERLLVDHECKAHGRLPGDPSPPCGCFASEENARLEDERVRVPATRNQTTRRFDHGECVRLYLSGWSGRQLAARYGVSRQSVHAVVGKCRS